MRRLPAVVFTLLAVATVGAFFVVQHLKVTTPLIAGFPAPDPSVLDPRAGGVCGGVNHRQMRISFYLKHRSDDVDVYVIDPGGAVVATLASGRHMEGGGHPVRSMFVWDGREDSGGYAPDGTYYVEVVLIHQDRTVVIAPTSGGSPSPVRVETQPPRPVVTAVSPHVVPERGSLRTTIHVGGNQGHAGTVRVYRTDGPGRPRLVKTFVAPLNGATAVWDGTIHGRAAPAGTYAVGLDVTNAACVTGHYPRQLPPVRGSTPHAGLSVRYLALSPPLVPVLAGTAATGGGGRCGRRVPMGTAAGRIAERPLLRPGGAGHARRARSQGPGGSPRAHRPGRGSGLHRAARGPLGPARARARRRAGIELAGPESGRRHR